MTAWRLLPGLFLALAAGAQAADWRYSFGVHDYVVPEAHSDTLGVDFRGSFDELTEKGRHYSGSMDVFVDHDQDHLDPDHIPIWWQVHLGTDTEIARSGSLHLYGTANFDTSMNTVSSIERRMIAMPAIIGAYEGDALHAKLSAAAGWFFQEIDDDVPKTRGYERGDFRSSTWAYSLATEATVRIGDNWSATGSAAGWWDGDQSLLEEFKASIRCDTRRWRKGSAVVLSADYHQFNLDPYTLPGLPLILPWDHDILFRLTLVDAW